MGNHASVVGVANKSQILDDDQAFTAMIRDWRVLDRHAVQEERVLRRDHRAAQVVRSLVQECAVLQWLMNAGWSHGLVVRHCHASLGIRIRED